MKYIENIARDIKTLKIQGATNVATQAVTALKKELVDQKNFEREKVEKLLEKGIKLLVETRETEPMMRNGLRYIEIEIKNEGWNSKDQFIKIVENTTNTILQLFTQTKEKISEIGSKRIPYGVTILSHCHSSSVTDTFVKAHKRGIDFKVIQTETRPMYQGRITARKLTDAGIDITMIVDSAARHFMKKADLVLVGCDAITSEGNVINKIGTSQVASAANEARIPFYVLSTLLKFDPITIHGEFEVIEERNADEVWSNPPKGLKIRNPAFDITRRDYIHGIISEVGIISPHSILDAINREYQWIVN